MQNPGPAPGLTKDGPGDAVTMAYIPTELPLSNPLVPGSEMENDGNGQKRSAPGLEGDQWRPAETLDRARSAPRRVQRRGPAELPGQARPHNGVETASCSAQPPQFVVDQSPVASPGAESEPFVLEETEVISSEEDGPWSAGFH